MDLPGSLPKLETPRTTTARRRRWVWWLAAVAGLALVAAGLLFAFGRRPPVETPETLSAEARNAYQARDWQRAEKAFARLAALHALSPDDQLLRARAAIARERPTEEVLQILDDVPDSSSGASEARLLAGQVELRENRVRLAEAYLLHSLKLDPNQIQARRELIFIYGMQLRRGDITSQFRELSKSVPLTYEQAFLWCLIRGSKWRAEEQAATLEKFLAADPEDRWSRLALADCYMILSRPAEAEKLLEPLPADDPEAVDRRARLALAQGDYQRVELLLAGTSDTHAGLARLHGALALHKRDAQEAIRHFQRALALEPDDRDAILGLARSYTLAGDLKKAEPYREAGRRLDEIATLIQYASTNKAQQDPDLAMKLGRACEDAGRFPEARAWYYLVIAHQDPLNREAQQAIYRVQKAADAANARARETPGAVHPTDGSG